MFLSKSSEKRFSVRVFYLPSLLIYVHGAALLLLLSVKLKVEISISIE